MRLRFIIILIALFPFVVHAHPGIGIVKDSKGNIYYTDIEKVWKISNGQKTVLLKDVHSHELYIDSNDNLYGEHLVYDAAGDVKWRHYLWRYTAGGRFDTVVGLREAFAFFDYSLARDAAGNEYYTRTKLANKDSGGIYKHLTDGSEQVFARGNFEGVNWLHPQNDGSLYYVKDNDVYLVMPDGIIIKLADEIASGRESFPANDNNKIVYGVWRDDSGNAYVAVFSDRQVKKIDRHGMITVVYQSQGNWAPLHGVFDNAGKLWLMETSDKNEVRVVEVGNEKAGIVQQVGLNYTLILVAIGILIVGVGVIYFMNRRSGNTARGETGLK